MIMHEYFDVPMHVPLKILIVTGMYPEPSRPGYGAFVFHQVDHLRRLGHIVDVLPIRGYLSKFNYFKAAFAVRRMTQRQHYDIVHAHYGLSGLPALFRAHTPLVVTLHGSDVLTSRLERLLSLLACKFSDAVITVSRRIAAVIPGTIIPTGVDLAVFKPISRGIARRRLGLPQTRRIVLFPFDPKRTVKRYALAAEATQILRDKGHDIDLLIVSTVPSNAMPDYYNAADAMILCSMSEGSPTVVKEALACELPVVSTDVGDVRELAERVRKILICDSTPEALADGLEKVLGDPLGFARPERDQLHTYDQRLTAAFIVGVYDRTLTNTE